MNASHAEDISFQFSSIEDDERAVSVLFYQKGCRHNKNVKSGKTRGRKFNCLANLGLVTRTVVYDDVAAHAHISKICNEILAVKRLGISHNKCYKRITGRYTRGSVA